ncbi:MAG: hypothetical protein P8099_04130 [Gemmatimonadota bacterium]|jgi:hypothetical protein
MSVAVLRELLEQQFPDAVPVGQGTTEVVATGIRALDEVLPGSGLPRGRVTVWSGGGATAVLRSVCEAAVGRGERAVWVDGSGSIVGSYWRPGPVLLRPVREDVLECAEVLLRSGGFAVVVVTGFGDRASGLPETPGVRLARAAHDGGGVLAALAMSAPLVHLRARSRIPPDGYHWRRNSFGEPAEVMAVTVEAHIEATGLRRRTHFTLPVSTHDVRMSLESDLADRRSVPPRRHPDRGTPTRPFHPDGESGRRGDTLQPCLHPDRETGGRGDGETRQIIASA